MSVDIGPRSSDVVNPTILLGARLNIDIPTELSGTFSALIGFSSGVAGLAHRAITPHTLCHTAITHLVQVGVDLSTVQCVSGTKASRWSVAMRTITPSMFRERLATSMVAYRSV